jgi:hypothetical protein
MLWRCPATDTFKWFVRAKERVRDTSSTVWTLTTPKTGVLFRQLASLMNPALASKGSGLEGGVTMRVVGFEVAGSLGNTKSQFFSRLGGEE